MSKIKPFPTRLIASIMLVVVFSARVLADCTCHAYGHCSAGASRDWPATSFDYSSNRIIFYINRNLSVRERALFYRALALWEPAMRANGLSYYVRPTTTHEDNHGIHEISIDWIPDNDDGNTLGVTYDGGVHHRHVIIDQGFWHGRYTDAQRVAVIAHEFGHVLGLAHSANHGDLMHDHYNPMNLYPTRTDLVRASSLLRQAVMRRRFGR